MGGRGRGGGGAGGEEARAGPPFSKVGMSPKWVEGAKIGERVGHGPGGFPGPGPGARGSGVGAALGLWLSRPSAGCLSKAPARAHQQKGCGSLPK